MDERLTELLTWLQETTEGATDFAVEQAPLVAQELMRLKLTFSLLGIIIGLVGLFAAVIAARRLWKNEGNAYENYDMRVPIHAMIVLVGSGFSILFIPISVIEVLEITIAPRLYILEWVIAKMGG